MVFLNCCRADEEAELLVLLLWSRDEPDGFCIKSEFVWLAGSLSGSADESLPSFSRLMQLLTVVLDGGPSNFSQLTSVQFRAEKERKKMVSLVAFLKGYFLYGKFEWTN